jgi:hypothetical protein
MLAAIETSLSVRCRYCEEFIRVSGSVAKKASRVTSDTEAWQWSSKAFVLRCRSCEKESVYTLNQIVNVPPIPPKEIHAQQQ